MAASSRATARTIVPTPGRLPSSLAGDSLVASRPAGRHDRLRREPRTGRGREPGSPAGIPTAEVPAAGNSSHSDAVKTDVTQAVSYTHLRAHETPEHLV